MAFDDFDDFGLDTPDPMAGFDRRMRRINSIVSGKKASRMGDLPPLTPQEEEGLLSGMGSVVKSGLSFVGDVLGTPGAFVTTAMSGADPFAGVFDPEKRKYGREMLESWGVLGPNQEGLDVGDVVGFGADLIADPLTYTTGFSGAINRAGRAAKAAGVLPKTGKLRAATSLDDILSTASPETADAIRRAMTAGSVTAEDAAGKLGGNLGFRIPGVPWLTDPIDIAQFDISPVGDAITGALKYVPGAKAAGEAYNKTKRWGRKVFDNDVLDTSQEITQDLAKEGTGEIGRRDAARTIEATQMARDLKEIGFPMEADGITDEFIRFVEQAATPGSQPRAATPAVNPFVGSVPSQFTNKMRAALDKLGIDYSNMTPQQGWDAINAAAQRPPMSPAAAKTVLTDDIVPKEWLPARDWINDFQAKSLQEKMAVGQLNEGLSDVIKRFPRSWTGIEYDDLMAGGREAFSGKAGANMARESWTKGFYGGTGEVKQIIKDVHALGLKTKKEIKDHLDTLGHWTDPDELEAAAKAIYNSSEESRKVGGFGNHPLSDVLRDMKQHNKSNVMAQKAILAAAKTLVDDVGDGSTIPLKSVARELNLKGPFYDAVAKANPDLAERLKVMVGAGVDPAKAMSKLRKNVLKKHIPKEIAKDLTRMIGAYKRPETANEILKAYDGFTNLWKGGVLGIWPSYHVRNFVSGQWNNVVGGVFSLDTAFDAAKMVNGAKIDAMKYVKAMGIKVPAGADNDWAMNRLWDELHARDMVGHSPLTETAGQTKGFQGTKFTIPGERSFPFGRPIETLKRAYTTSAPPKMGGKAESINPFKVRGVGGLDNNKFGPAVFGDDLAWATDANNKIAGFLHQVKKGVDPEVAAKRMDALQVNYSKKSLTQTEKEWLRRLFPFYSFTKGMLPTVLNELVQHPGGKMAKTLRLSAQARQDQGPLPASVTSGLTIPSPLGSPVKDGTKNFISSMGLMYEDPLSLLQVGDSGFDTAKKTTTSILSRLNPAAKIPIEMATGRLLFSQGRDIEDADPALGRLISNLSGKESPTRLPEGLEYMVNATPYAGRSVSTANNALDDRKGVIERLGNVFTGFKTTSVSPALQRVVIQDRIKEMMRDRGGRIMERAYIPEWVEQNMTKEELSFIEELQNLNRLQDQRNRAARK